MTNHLFFHSEAVVLRPWSCKYVVVSLSKGLYLHLLQMAELDDDAAHCCKYV